MTVAKLTAVQFAEKRPALVDALTKGLDKELKDCAWQADPNSDLWNLPTVDSKTVCKLSPVFEAVLGHKLQPVWVRKGGYDSVAEAVTDVVAKAEKHCVVPAMPALAAE